MSSDSTTKEQAASVRVEGHVQPAILAAFVAGSATFRVFPIGDQPLVVGRGEGSAFVLQDDRLSRQHVTVSFAQGLWRVRELGSRNATYVDGHGITGEWSGAAPRTLRMGQTVLVFIPDLTRLAHPHQLFDPTMVRGPTMQAALDLVGQAARDGLNVLITGETGSGKELAAQTYHAATQRSGPMQTLNCAAVAEPLLESELFGHARGAFSGAAQARAGLLEAAHGGTLFLDELGEMPLTMQAKLLRAIQEREVRRVGENDVRRVNVRIVAATNRDLGERIRAGLFRDDLFYRLAESAVPLPPLRERPEEIGYLIALGLRPFLPQLGIDSSLIEHCLLRPWLGNVRELLGSVRAAASGARLGGANVVSASHLPPLLAGAPHEPISKAHSTSASTPAPPTDATAPARALKRDEREAAIVEAFRKNPRADAHAIAQSVGVSAATVYRVLQRIGGRSGS